MGLSNEYAIILNGSIATGLFKLAITPESLTVILAGSLALLFDWFPGLAQWFEAQSKLRKRLLMIGLLGAVVALIAAGACRGLFETGLACELQSLPVLLQYILIAAGANQAVHLLGKPATAGRG